MINTFFDKLSYRFRNENQLSDITWTLAETCPVFKRLFIQFFFVDITDLSGLTVFKREHFWGDCRPDFYIEINNKSIIIESKIYDQNHHFDQYEKSFPDARFGYITNYFLKERPGFEIRSWESFARYLNKALELGDIGSESKQLISGYIKFIINICAIFQVKKMNLNNLTSLHYFIRLVEKTVNSIEGYETSINNQLKNFDSKRSGRYFNLKKNNSITICPWLGVYYAEEVSIYIEFSRWGCEPIYDGLELKESFTEGEYYSAPYMDNEYGETICFELKEIFLKNFNDDITSIEEQERIIKTFLNEVLSFVNTYLTDEPPVGIAYL